MPVHRTAASSRIANFLKSRSGKPDSVRGALRAGKSRTRPVLKRARKQRRSGASS